MDNRPNSTKTGPDRNRESVPGLVKQVFNDTSSLLVKEIALVRSEISQAVTGAQRGLISVATGGAVTYAGFLFLLLSATLGLAYVVDFWLSALIVGGAVLIVGLIMLQAGKKKLEPEAFKPDHTINTIRKHGEAVRGQDHDYH